MKTKITLPVIMSLSLASAAADAQEIPEDIDPAARMGVLGVNTALQTSICGIVAAVNDRNILKDIGKCFGGATIQFIGMEMGVHEAPVLPGFGLRTVETGTSIIYNTLQGKEPFETLQYELGPGLIEIDTKKFDMRLFWRPYPIYGAIYFMAKGYKFNLGDTMNYQTPVFELTRDSLNVVGHTEANLMAYDKNYPSAKAHEFIHVMQYVRYRPFQLLVPDSFSFFEDEAYMRIGEDIAKTMVSLPNSICHLGGESCSRRWWAVNELEAHLMAAGYEDQNKYEEIK